MTAAPLLAAPLLAAYDLFCLRDQRFLFKQLELTLAKGESLHIMGANGAGKTSLLRILCGLLSPYQGVIHWRGEDIQNCPSEYHQHLLYIGHTPGLKDELTALQNLSFYGALDGTKPVRSALLAALQQVGLEYYEDLPVRHLSAGQKRRVALARLWLSQAKLWILDEPFTALDRAGISHLEQHLAQHCDQGGSLILTSHQQVNLPALKQLQL